MRQHEPGKLATRPFLEVLCLEAQCGPTQAGTVHNTISSTTADSWGIKIRSNLSDMFVHVPCMYGLSTMHTWKAYGTLLIFIAQR
jgi:hypothetical protein